jgi:pyrimidine-nucleoside phosphorylase
MKTEAESRRLAESLVSIGNASGVKTEALITDMDAPLGRAVGNSNEVIECIDAMRGKGPSDLMEVTMALTATLLVLGKAAATLDDGRRMAQRAIDSGAALERFRRIIEVQGGDPRVVDDVSRLPSADKRHVVKADRSGYVVRMDAGLVGRASVALGAGRDRVEDPVDPAVGILVDAKPGAQVRAGDRLLEVTYRDDQRLERAKQLLMQAIAIGEAPPVHRPLILGEVR